MSDKMLKEINEEATIEKPMNIYQKMSAITSELKKVAKNSSVGVGKSSYKAVGEADILEAVKPIEEKYRVYSFPYRRSIEDSGVMESEKIDYNTKQPLKTKQLFMRIQTIYRFVNMDNTDEFIDIFTYGDGVDSQDKAPGKAMTYADKYALMKAYKIITGDDPDVSESEKLLNLEEKKQKKQDSEKQTPKKETPKDVNALITEWQLCRTKMFDLGIDFRSETIKQWIADKTGYGSQDASQDYDHMKATVDAYHHLIKGKEAKGGKLNDQ